MTGADDDLERRVGAVERRGAHLDEEVRAARTLAAGADRDVSELRHQRHADLQLLRALRETQVEHGRRLDAVESQVRLGFAEMRRGFATMQVGMSQIVGLLERDAED